MFVARLSKEPAEILGLWFDKISAAAESSDKRPEPEDKSL